MERLIVVKSVINAETNLGYRQNLQSLIKDYYFLFKLLLFEDVEVLCPTGKISAVIGTYINGRVINQKGFQQLH